MLISDIMVKNPIKVSPDDSLAHVIDIMGNKGIGFIVVAHEGKAVGVITEGDIVSLSAQRLEMSSALVKSYMHTPIFSVPEDANVFFAYDELVVRKMRHLVVENDAGDLVGVVTMSNFIANLGVEHFSKLQQVSDILTPVNVTVSPDTPLNEAIRLMQLHRHAMIAIEKGKAVGILTSRSITRLANIPQEQRDAMVMADAMRDPVLVHRKAYVPEASTLMKMNRTRHLIAVGDQDEFMGLVTISDVAHSMEGRYVEFMRSVMRDMEKDLLTTGSHKRALFERNPNAVFSLDCDGVIEHVNPAAILLTGYSSDFLIGTPAIELFTDVCLHAGKSAMSAALQGDAQSVQIQIQGIDQRVIHVFLSFVPIMVDGELSGVYAVGFDITDRVLAEHRLHKLSQALQQAGEPIAIVDRYGVIEYANSELHKMFSYEDGDLVGKRLKELECVQPGEESHYKGIITSIIDGLPFKGEFLHRDNNNDILDLKVSASPVHVPGSPNVNYFINIYEDMSSRREAERQAVRSQKMETIATLAGGIAHDFNNYLAAMTSSLYLLRRDAADNPRMIERLNKLDGLSERAAALISQLLTFARQEVPNKSLISLSNILEETKELCMLLVPNHNITLDWKVARDMCIHGDAGEIQQVVLNLVKNACDAMEKTPSGTVSIEMSVAEKGHHYPEGFRHVRDRSYAKLIVRDTGSGINEKVLPSIFDPFFTTKGLGKGTGLGLAMVYGTMQKHQGFIDVKSSIGVGTEFVLYFPLSSESFSSRNSSIHRHATNKLLLVDDELAMLEVGTEVIETLGYSVVSCDNGEDAIALFRENPEKFSIVVLDVLMPRKNGVETAAEIRDIKGDIPILFATGYDQNAVSKDILADPNTDLLRKPWKPEKLEEMIQNLISK